MGLFSSIFGSSKKTSSTSNQTATTTQNPYAATIPALNNYVGQLQNTYNSTPAISAAEQNGYNNLTANASTGTSAQAQGIQDLINSYFKGGTNTTQTSGLDALNTATANGGVNSLEQTGITGLNNASITDPSSYFNTSEQTLQDTAAGKYLTADTNPYLADIATRVSGLAGAASNATFAGRGRSGSGLAGYYSGKATTDSLTDLYGQEYESERQRQQAAATAATGFDAQTLANDQAKAQLASNQISAGQSVNQQGLTNANATLSAGNDLWNQALAASQAQTAQGTALTNAGTAANSTALADANALITAGQAQSARPFDLSAQYGDILAKIAGLGGSTTSTGSSSSTGKTTSTPSLFDAMSSVAKLFAGGAGG